jgi:hypothetical protein
MLQALYSLTIREVCAIGFLLFHDKLSLCHGQLISMTQTKLVMEEWNANSTNLTCHGKIENLWHKLSLSWKNRMTMTQS